MDTTEKPNKRFTLIMRACGGDLDKLRGDRFKPLRKELIQLATGEKPKANECGIHRTISIVYDYVVGIETNDEREMIDALKYVYGGVK